MSIFGQILGTVLWLYWLVLIAPPGPGLRPDFRAILAASGTASVDRRIRVLDHGSTPCAPFDG